MARKTCRFFKREDGAVTADFVIVVAAVVTLGISLMATLADGALDSSELVNTRLETNSSVTITARTD